MIFDFEGGQRTLVDHEAFSSDLSRVPGNGNVGGVVSLLRPAAAHQAANRCEPSFPSLYSAGSRQPGTAPPRAVARVVGPGDRARRDGYGRQLLCAPADAGEISEMLGIPR